MRRWLFALALLWGALPTWAQAASEVKISWPAAGYVRFELCRGQKCTPLGSKDGTFAVDDVRAELNVLAVAGDPDRKLRHVDSFLTALAYPTMVSAAVMTVLGVTGSHVVSDQIRTMLFMPSILIASIAMKFNDVLNQRAFDRELDAEILSDAAEGRLSASVPFLRVNWLRKRLDNIVRCRKELAEP